MNKYKYITTTLPYLNSTPHIGHCFEFVLADVISEYYRLDHNVLFNVGVDEHGQKVYQKAVEEGYDNTQEYCDDVCEKWKCFCAKLGIYYDNFYRTTDNRHKKNVLRFYNEIKQHIFSKEYEGKYCVGCEAFVTEKEIIDGKCSIHNSELVSTKEVNKFFNLSKFSDAIKDVLVDKNKSSELRNIIQDNFDLSITRQNVKWGISTEDGDVFYVWFEALLNYIFAIKYYEDREHFNNYWKNSLIICGKDNLKFQAYILQALLLSNDIPQTDKVFVHGNIQDASGVKLGKSLGNTIDPVEQVDKYGLDAVRYYLVFGLNTFSDSKYSEIDLVQKWNNDIVNGLGNLISRVLHLVDIKNIILNETTLSKDTVDKIQTNSDKINKKFEEYNLKEVGILLNSIVNNLNKRITEERPFDKHCENYSEILNELYFELKDIIGFYGLVIKEHKEQLDSAFVENKKKIIFERI